MARMHRSKTSARLRSFYASVTRRLADGRMFYPDQRMTREQALRSYTLDAAYRRV